MPILLRRKNEQVYYNEIDKLNCEWLRNLMIAGMIPPGVIDSRDIRNVHPTEVKGFSQRHWFAGIGGWAYALKLAGWGDRPVDTGSCPCQPFSTSGNREGFADARDLWPEMFRILRACRPVTVFGEQVENANVFGWFDRICADLEGEGYSCGQTILGAHSAGAPHQRGRMYWIADADRVRDGDLSQSRLSQLQRELLHETGRVQETNRSPDRYGHRVWGSYSLQGTDQRRRRIESGLFPLVNGFSQYVGHLLPALVRLGYSRKDLRPISERARLNYDCRIKGYGNAIVPQVAALFVKAFMEIKGMNPIFDESTNGHGEGNGDGKGEGKG